MWDVWRSGRGRRSASPPATTSLSSSSSSQSVSSSSSSSSSASLWSSLSHYPRFSLQKVLSKIVKFSFKEIFDVLLVLLVIDKSAFYLIRRLVSRCKEPSFTTTRWWMSRHKFLRKSLRSVWKKIWKPIISRRSNKQGDSPIFHISISFNFTLYGGINEGGRCQ